jgi:ATP-dependent DNA helicase Rep
VPNVLRPTAKSAALHACCAAERWTPITAAGNDYRSIYGWRGATIENLKRLPQEFPRLPVIPLEQN